MRRSLFCPSTRVRAQCPSSGRWSCSPAPSSLSASPSYRSSSGPRRSHHWFFLVSLNPAHFIAVLPITTNRFELPRWVLILSIIPQQFWPLPQSPLVFSGKSWPCQSYGSSIWAFFDKFWSYNRGFGHSHKPLLALQQGKIWPSPLYRNSFGEKRSHLWFFLVSLDPANYITVLAKNHRPLCFRTR